MGIWELFSTSRNIRQTGQVSCFVEKNAVLVSYTPGSESQLCHVNFVSMGYLTSTNFSFLISKMGLIRSITSATTENK